MNSRQRKYKKKKTKKKRKKDFVHFGNDWNTPANWFQSIKWDSVACCRCTHIIFFFYFLLFSFSLLLFLCLLLCSVAASHLAPRFGLIFIFAWHCIHSVCPADHLKSPIRAVNLRKTTPISPNRQLNLTFLIGYLVFMRCGKNEQNNCRVRYRPKEGWEGDGGENIRVEKSECEWKTILMTHIFRKDSMRPINGKPDKEKRASHRGCRVAQQPAQWEPKPNDPDCMGWRSGLRWKSGRKV